MTWDLSCRDWAARLKAGRTLVPELPLNAIEGDRAVAVLNRLRLADVTGTPTFGEAGGEWFRDIVRAMFGSVDPVTKARMIRELFLLVPKKNSKTTNGALLMLTALLLNQRPRAPFLLTAPFQKTADEAFSAIAGAIALDPVLEAKLHVRDHLKTIVHRETQANLQIMTFDPKAVTGKKVVGALIDELHVLGKIPRADKAMLQLRGGMQPFPEAFLAIITTQSDDAPAGVFKDDLEKARGVRDGTRQSAMLPVLYEYPEAMQRDPTKPWRDPINWPMVTPNLGLSIDIERLKPAFADEEAKGDAALRLWASQHLNIEIGLALHSDRWAGADFWEAAVDPTLTLDTLLKRCEVVVVGIDGGGLDDLLGLCVMGRERDTRKWLIWCHAWAHEIVLERRKDIASRLLDFQKDRDLTVVKRPGDDVEMVADIVCRIKAAGLLPEKQAIGVDTAGITDIVDELTAPGRDISMEQIIGVSQGWRLNGAIKTTERKLAGGELIHGGRALMAWCVGNAKSEPKGNADLITKSASGKAKVDPLMAVFDCTTLMATNPASAEKKYQIFVV
ncbi:phage terminase large subunit-like protein [Variovorax boronicumulans]|uniref:terminase TerL endonuclease subunit n=1 Tax=Variovorax boronicumulans TaxID=436515 RepID=UPI0027834ED4|nr:terminase TerL endonuclease subunit [Variovorax boronicumulans]MDP9991979.1 phage terminase large subunit-like protein [Variovorax boronicumulans]MDQ0001874.1 phage terminase large subunit-like protein [Variovorax boronicumulans]